MPDAADLPPTLDERLAGPTCPQFIRRPPAGNSRTARAAAANDRQPTASEPPIGRLVLRAASPESMPVKPFGRVADNRATGILSIGASENGTVAISTANVSVATTGLSSSAAGTVGQAGSDTRNASSAVPDAYRLRVAPESGRRGTESRRHGRNRGRREGRPQMAGRQPIGQRPLGRGGTRRRPRNQRGRPRPRRRRRHGRHAP